MSEERVTRAKHEEIRWEALTDATRKYRCGHRGPKRFSVDFFGQVLELAKPTPDCPECFVFELARTVCRCSLCGLVILPGDGVAVYHLCDKTQKLNSHWTTRVAAGYVGCLRMGCCPSGAFFSGHWLKGNFRPAFAGGMSAVAIAFATSQSVCGNVGDTSQNCGHDEVPLKRPLIVVNQHPSLRPAPVPANESYFRAAWRWLFGK